MNNLSGPELGNKINPDKIVIFLHGYGADGDDLISLSHYYKNILPNAYFCSPHAHQPGEYGFGRQWFSLKDRSEAAMYQGVVQAAPVIENYINHLKSKFNLNYSDIYLIGFSQGSMMAMHIAPRLIESIGAIISFSGALINPDILKDEVRSKPNMLVIHGQDDEIVPPESLNLAVNYLGDENFMVESHLLKNLGHSINQTALDLSIDFLSRN